MIYFYYILFVLYSMIAYTVYCRNMKIIHSSPKFKEEKIKHYFIAISLTIFWVLPWIIEFSKFCYFSLKEFSLNVVNIFKFK